MASKTGILDGPLRKHLKFVKEIYVTERAAILRMNADHERAYQENFVNFDAELDLQLRNKSSIELRAYGNQLFKNGEFFKAKLAFTHSLAPVRGGPLAAMAYASRSAALYFMNCYEECLKDIDRTLAIIYPDKLKYMLLLRRAKCLKFLDQEYQTALNDALESVEKYHKDDSDKLRAVILKDIESAPPVYDAGDMPKQHEWTLPELSYGPNTEIPSFSSAVTLCHNERYGRHIIANRNLNTGDVLVIDKCSMTALAEEVHWDYCMTCFKPFATLIPCPECGVVMYCSKECRLVDWETAHKNSCYETKGYYNTGLMKSVYEQMEENVTPTLREFFSQSIVVHRLVGYFGLENLKEIVCQNKVLKTLNQADLRTRGFKNGKFEEFNIESFLSLDDNFDKTNPTNLAKWGKLSFSLAGVYRTPDSELFPVAALFMKFLMIVYYNKKFIFADKANYFKAGLLRTILGTGLYMASSLINNACDANMLHVNYGSTSVYRARRPIKKGDQLTECYLYSMDNCAFRKRQEFIESTFGYECNCDACEHVYPVVPQMTLNFSEDITKMMQDAGFDFSKNSADLSKFYQFCEHGLGCDIELLPKMVKLLKKFHLAGKTLHQWYYLMQDSITNHYRAKGNCFFYNKTKDLMDGVIKFDATDIKKLKNLKNPYFEAGTRSGTGFVTKFKN